MEEEPEEVVTKQIQLANLIIDLAIKSEATEVTLTNPKTGAQRTFKMLAPKKPEGPSQ